MKQKSLYIYLAAYLTILIPPPGRFVYGVTILLELALLMFVGIFINLLTEKLKLKELKSIVLMFVLLAITILYRQFFVLVQPEIALTLGFTFYLPTLSMFLSGFLLIDNTMDLKANLKKYAIEMSLFTSSGLIFFLFRDIFGYGTFTFFGNKHRIFELIIFNADRAGVFSFFASIPGALFLVGIILYIHLVIKQKIKVIQNSEEQK